MAFPGAPRPQPGQEEPPEEEDDESSPTLASDEEPADSAVPEEEAPVSSEEDEDEDGEDTQAPPSAQVIPFPEEESALSAFLKKMGTKADQYADSMFEEDEATDHEEVRRLERLIPGTDQEDVEEEPAPPKWHPA